MIVAWLAVASADEATLRTALEAELARATRELAIPDEEPPYLVTYDVLDGAYVTWHAELGAPLRIDEGPFRRLRVDVRTGGYAFDSSNFDALGQPDGTTVVGLPLEDDELALRREIWRATDRAYKQAVEQLGRKEAELSAMRDELPPDFLAIDPPTSGPVPARVVEHAPIEQRVLACSRALAEVPGLESGEAAGQDLALSRLTVSSEGTRLARGEGYAIVRVEGVMRAADGTRLRDGRWWVAATPEGLPSVEEMVAETRALGAWLEVAAQAEVLDDYIGPVLFDGPAAVELFRQLAAPELVGTPPMREARGMFGEPSPEPRATARVGRRLLPEGWTLVDDPTLDGTPGSYVWDHEAVPASRVTLVEDGVVQRLLMSRVPRDVDDASTGHGRSRGSDRRSALPAVVRVTPKRAWSERRLRRRALRMARSVGRDHVLVIRRLEPPSMTEDFQVFFTGDGPPPGLTPPYEAFRLYADGREEVVRGATFVGADRRALRDIAGAGEVGPWVGVMDEQPGPGRFSVGALGGLPAAWSVPAVLISELELEGRSGGDQREIPAP